MAGFGAKLGGGKFNHAFIAAGFSAAFKSMLNDIGGTNSANTAIKEGNLGKLNIHKVDRAIAAALIGGTASKLSGGKFANGALSGALAQMYNGDKTSKKQIETKIRAEKLLKDPRVQALLEIIAEGESKGDYNVQYGGTRFKDYSKHPGTQSNGSSAAGKYQLVKATWRSLARSAGLTDFSPHSQDIAAVLLLEERGAIYQLQQDNPVGAISRAATVWEALPYSVHSSGAFGLSYYNKHLRQSFEYLEKDYRRRLFHGN